jgi:hypothetical protein
MRKCTDLPARPFRRSNVKDPPTVAPTTFSVVPQFLDSAESNMRTCFWRPVWGGFAWLHEVGEDGVSLNRVLVPQLLAARNSFQRKDKKQQEKLLREATEAKRHGKGTRRKSKNV